MCAACKNGPKVTYCIIDSANGGAQCADYRKVEYFKPIADLDNYDCLNPRHTERLLKFCKVGGPAPDVDFCVVDGPEARLYCFDDNLSLAEAENFSCMSPADTERLLDFCARKKRK